MRPGGAWRERGYAARPEPTVRKIFLFLALILPGCIDWGLVEGVFCRDGEDCGAGGSGAVGGTGGATASSTGGSDTTSSTITSTDTDPLTCDYYCAEVQKTCTGQNAQYESAAACVFVCETFVLGSLGDAKGPTLGCRIRELELAQKDPVGRCPNVGPLGAGTCGVSCGNFCHAEDVICGEQAVKSYTSLSDCHTKCGTFDDPLYSSTIKSGDSVACRMTKLASAASGGAAGACQQIGPNSNFCK